ncbi:hypothetical protein [Paracoccus sp. (in: a-proteobacteria)]|uniref:hypothetical protein n=1 Tax=Paracoccus sp. TaxID=267 RepID=UPI0026DF594E|nr:hypothetical protein [Paracoccus sp. (in: a-proteobacteria)]MDO5646715.1 hypothetical protein [Paracoccus sp. (in: a-proteobacteria)]
MQMIVHYALTDYDQFKAAFDNDAEDRSLNGLSVLQLWREETGDAWALFNVTDAKAARDYLDGSATVFNNQAGVTSTDYHLVKTA